MPPKARPVLLSMIFAFSATFGIAGTVRADQLPNYHGQMIVENVWVTPARKGERSTLHLRLTNDGYDHAHLLGVETPVASDTRIVGRIGDHKTATFDSVSVRADSDLDLTSDHMWIELGPLAREVKAGESIPLELVFVRSRMRVDAHVHSADG